MAEALSTKDILVRWAGEVGEVHQLDETRHFLFAQEDGHLLVQEQVREGFASDTASRTTVLPLSTEKTMPDQLERRAPRAWLVSTRSDDRYILLKKYEGVVTSRGAKSFTARLYENADDYPVLEAEFDLEELSEKDRVLAIEGATLVWTIGYSCEGSTRKRESTIYLRRLPPWSDKEIEQSSRAANELTHGIQWK